MLKLYYVIKYLLEKENELPTKVHVLNILFK